MKPGRQSAHDIMDVLREKLWTDGAHAWLYEVANATGGRASRFADALVCSCWPSRGLWLAGVEAKISRSDWTREKDDPKKSQELQKYCSYWWLVSTLNVARPEEIPLNWGHIEVAGSKYTIIKQAPELKPEPPTIDLVASIARNSAMEIENAITRRANKMIETERDMLRDERHKLEEMRREAGGPGNLLASYRELIAQCDKFEAETGLNIRSDWRLGSSIETIQLAEKLTGFRGIHRLRKELMNMSKTLAALDVEKDEAAE
jgi:hypothetical protein